MPLIQRTGLIGLAIVVAASAPIVAQSQSAPTPAPAPAMQKPGAKDAARITGGTYKIDNEHTFVRWQVDHMGITPYTGLFGQITGTLTLDPKAVEAAKVDVTIPIAKVTTASPGLTRHLLKAPEKAGGKPDFFGPAPVDARFVSTSVVRGKDADEARITGNLTLNGVTRPVTLEAEFYGAGAMPKEMGGGEMVGFTAETRLRRSDFGIDMGIPMVSDEVELEVVAAFVK